MTRVKVNWKRKREREINPKGDGMGWGMTKRMIYNERRRVAQ